MFPPNQNPNQNSPFTSYIQPPLQPKPEPGIFDKMLNYGKEVIDKPSKLINPYVIGAAAAGAGAYAGDVFADHHNTNVDQHNKEDYANSTIKLKNLEQTGASLNKFNNDSTYENQMLKYGLNNGNNNVKDLWEKINKLEETDPELKEAQMNAMQHPNDSGAASHLKSVMERIHHNQDFLKLKYNEMTDHSGEAGDLNGRFNEDTQKFLEGRKSPSSNLSSWMPDWVPFNDHDLDNPSKTSQNILNQITSNNKTFDALPQNVNNITDHNKNGLAHLKSTFNNNIHQTEHHLTGLKSAIEHQKETDEAFSKKSKIIGAGAGLGAGAAAGYLLKPKEEDKKPEETVGDIIKKKQFNESSELFPALNPNILPQTKKPAWYRAPDGGIYPSYAVGGVGMSSVIGNELAGNENIAGLTALGTTLAYEDLRDKEIEAKRRNQEAQEARNRLYQI